MDSIILVNQRVGTNETLEVVALNDFLVKIETPKLSWYLNYDDAKRLNTWLSRWIEISK